MGIIPKAHMTEPVSRIPFENPQIGYNNNVLFSFAAIQEHEYFNLDATCPNWAADLFKVLQNVSAIKVSDIYAGVYSGKGSTLRIHAHKGKRNPCAIPKNVKLEDMWQIRIGKSKGGIHGVFYENVFYVIWFDPQHNLYPDENHGGLKIIKPPTTCCKERDRELKILADENAKLKEENKEYEKLFNEMAAK